jgi:NTP pyrophosphatase (non-canonical NTP hydrolase)
MSTSGLNDYQKFVKSTTSQESTTWLSYEKRAKKLYIEEGLNIPLLSTAAIGMGSEAGEFQEIVKKIIFQGKEYSEDTRFHMKRELGDVLWYVANAATALGYTLDEIVEGNIAKLESRYPNGFEVYRSENREEGDL